MASSSSTQPKCDSSDGVLQLHQDEIEKKKKKGGAGERNLKMALGSGADDMLSLRAAAVCKSPAPLNCADNLHSLRDMVL